MPVMNGYISCQKIRKLYPKDSRLKIVALTADATIDNKNRCIKAGFD